MTRLAFLGLAVLLTACSNETNEKPNAEADAGKQPADGPGGVYLKVYAMKFVEAMRGAGLKAGAFEISKHSEADGRYHLGVDVTEGDTTKRLLVKLRPMGRGLTPITATLTPPGEKVFPGGKGAWTRLAGWHALADRAARTER